jgi:hypothetical protein
MSQHMTTGVPVGRFGTALRETAFTLFGLRCALVRSGQRHVRHEAVWPPTHHFYGRPREACTPRTAT